MIGQFTKSLRILMAGDLIITRIRTRLLIMFIFIFIYAIGENVFL